MKLLPKTRGYLCLGPYQEKNQIWRNSKKGSKSQFSIHVLWHKDPCVFSLLCIVQKMDPDGWPIISLFAYSCPRSPFLFTQIPFVLHQTIFQSPRRALQKPSWDSIFKQNRYLVTLTISRVFFITKFTSGILAERLWPLWRPRGRSGCMGCVTLGAAAEPRLGLLFDPGAAELTDKVAALQGDIQTSRQVPQQSQGQLFLPHTVTISWKCQRPKVTAVPWQYL